MSKTGPWTYCISICADANEDILYYNMPNEKSFLFNSSRHIAATYLTGITYARLLVNKQSVAGCSGSKLSLKYGTVFSNDPLDYIDLGVTPIEVNIDVENTFLKTDWIQLVTQEDVFLAIVGSGGDGVITPGFGNISLEFC